MSILVGGLGSSSEHVGLGQGVPCLMSREGRLGLVLGERGNGHIGNPHVDRLTDRQSERHV